jgi:hypothetical protein
VDGRGVDGRGVDGRGVDGREGKGKWYVVVSLMQGHHLAPNAGRKPPNPPNLIDTTKEVSVRPFVENGGAPKLLSSASGRHSGVEPEEPYFLPVSCPYISSTFPRFCRRHTRPLAPAAGEGKERDRPLRSINLGPARWSPPSDQSMLGHHLCAC